MSSEEFEERVWKALNDINCKLANMSACMEHPDIRVKDFEELKAKVKELEEWKISFLASISTASKIFIGVFGGGSILNILIFIYYIVHLMGGKP